MRNQFQNLIKDLQHKVDLLDERAIKGDHAAIAQRHAYIEALTGIKTVIIKQEQEEEQRRTDEINDCLPSFHVDEAVRDVQGYIDEAMSTARDDLYDQVVDQLSEEHGWSEVKIEFFNDDILTAVDEHVHAEFSYHVSI